MEALDFVVSPELVLVDPELADRVRRADSTPRWVPFSPPETLPDVVRPSPPAVEALEPERESHQVESARTPRRKRLFHLALGLSLGLNVFVFTNVYEDSTHTVQAPIGSKLPASGVSQRTPAYRPPLEAESLAETAERSVLVSLSRNPILRQEYTAASTGLPLPGLSAHCYPRNQAPVSLPVLRCVVWRQVAGERLARTIEYHVLRRGGFRITVVG